MPQRTEVPVIAVLGLSWGRHFVRILDGLGVKTAGFDTNPSVRTAVLRSYPGLTVGSDSSAAFTDPRIRAVIIATPSSTHYALAKSALSAGKSVLIEKPMTQDPREATDLVRLAERMRAVLMVGHTFAFSPAVTHVRHLIDAGVLGKIRSVESVRIGPGIIRNDSTVLWDLLPHDLTIGHVILGAYPHGGRARVMPGTDIPQEARVTFRYPGGIRYGAHISWIRPAKVRRITVTGRLGSVRIDWNGTQERVELTSRSPSDGTTGTVIRIFRDAEPLERMIRHFLASLAGGGAPITGGEDGVRIVQSIAGLRVSRGRLTETGNRKNSRSASASGQGSAASSDGRT